MKSIVIISLFQTVRLSMSVFPVCKFVLSPIKYILSLLIRFQLAKSIWCLSEITSYTFALHLDIDDVASANVT